MADGNFETNAPIAWVVYVLLDRDTDMALMEDRGGRIGTIYPGGNIDGADSPEATAARECMEEIGVYARLAWFPIHGREPLMHRGRQGLLYVCTDWIGQIPDYTIDEHARRLVWINPNFYVGTPPEETGGFQVGRVARRLVDWMDL